MIVKKHVFPLNTWSKSRPRQEPELYPGKSGTFRAPIPTKLQQLGSVSSPAGGLSACPRLGRALPIFLGEAV